MRPKLKLPKYDFHEIGQTFAINSNCCSASVLKNSRVSTPHNHPGITMILHFLNLFQDVFVISANPFVALENISYICDQDFVLLSLRLPI